MSWRFGREPQVRNASWQERVLTKFAPYVVKGAHRGDAPQMGIYSPVIRPIKISAQRAVF